MEFLSSHFHLVFKSQPEIVKTWSSRELAQRWLMLCPKRKRRDGSPAELEESDYTSAQRRIADKYSLATSTDLRQVVEKGKENVFALEVEKKK